MLRLLPLLALTGCLLPEDADDDPPPAVCGNGVVESYAGEQCDVGIDSDRCSSTCKIVEPYVVHWRSTSVSGAVHSCPAGFDLADIVVQPVVTPADCYPQLDDCSFMPNGPEVVFTAACADGAERIHLPPVLTHEGYRVSVRFASSSSGEVYGQTLPSWLREVTDAVMYEDSGFLHVAWNFRDANGAALDCFNANIPDVTINAKDADGWTAATLTVPCNELSTYTPPIVGTTYTVELVTSRAAKTLTDITVGRRSAVTDLGTVTFMLP